VPQPDPNGPSEAVAFCHVEAGDDPKRFYGSHREGVYAATDFGPQPDGQGSNIILSGYKKAIEELADAEPENVMTWWIRGTSALHSPLRRPSSDFMRSYLEILEFRDPVIPLAGCLDPAPLATGEDVREAIWLNWVRTASLPLGIANMVGAGVELLIVPGPSMLDEHLSLIDFPFPILSVREPADVEVAVARVEELRVRTGV
jgi:[acyl-carrier-protein] S-malonyltransferase